MQLAHSNNTYTLPITFISRTITLLLVAFAFASGARGDFISLSDVADTSLYENNPDANLGATTLVSGQNERNSVARSLFRFDLGAIPANATITQVTFSLSVVRQPDPDQHSIVNSDFSLYHLYADWGEGSGNAVTGSNAQPGDSTWNDRHFGSVSWTVPGGLAGVDFASTASTTTTIGNKGLYSWPSTGTLISDVQSWLDDPASNFGFILISQSEDTAGSARRFSSKEQPTGGTPPTLNITYSTVPEPAASWMLLSGLVCLIAFARARI